MIEEQTNWYKERATLITNLPSEVWVRKEYLTDHKSGQVNFVKGSLGI
ncbi:MAG: hypothetical protein CM15mP113_1130 [Pseudomonadota bacterium]|nr:MAG: hypothetical protein CM15mP113_1130 [Pseudomonadota bacterium]